MKLNVALIVLCLSVGILTEAQSGLYMRTQFWGSQLDISWLYFTADKKVIRNPLYGVNPLQIQKELAENSKNVASYSLAGNKMNLKWGDGKTQSVNVEFKAGVLAGFDGGICTKAAAFPFRFFQDKTYSGLATFGSVSRSMVLFLGKDGKFRTERVGAISGSGNTSGVAAVKANDGGTYIISGNTIVFKYTDGKEWRTIAQPYDMGKEEIIINDQLFKLK